MGPADKDNELIDKYRYGEDGYAVVWPYDVDMEALMFAVEKMMKEGHAFDMNYESYVFGTKMGWTVDIGKYQGTGGEMRDACYNAVLKFVKNEQKEDEKESNVGQGET